MRKESPVRSPRTPASRLDVINYHNGVCHCQDTTCSCHEAMNQVRVERMPVTRVPVTQKHLISVMTGKFECQEKNCRCHEATPYYGNAFFDSITKLVWMLANKYSISCPLTDVSDLSEICLDRILKNLHKYDPQWAVSTWVWRVCQNILNREYEQNRRSVEIFDTLDGTHDYGKTDRDAFIARDMTAAIRQLRAENPKWENVLLAMFGDVDAKDYCMPDRLCVAEVVRKTRRQYNDVHLFVKNVVRPFFAKRFQVNGGAK